MSDKIEKLKELRDLLEQGLIEQSEYNALKSEVIGGVKPLSKGSFERDTSTKKEEYKAASEPKNVSPSITKKVSRPEVEKPVKTEASEKTKTEPTVSKVIKTKKGVKPLPPSSNVPKGQEKVKLVPKGKPGQPRVVLVPKGAQQKVTSATDGGESSSGGKKKSSMLAYVIIGLIIIIGGVIATYFLTQGASAIESEKAIATVDRYIMSTRLSLAKHPGEDADIHYNMDFGEKIKVIENTDTIIGNFTYVKAFHNNLEGWVSSKAKSVKLISELSEIEEVKSVFKGDYVVEEMESLPAFVKYAIIDLSKQEGFVINTNDNDNYSSSMVKSYRSRLENRSSSSDKKSNRNNDPKDIILAAIKSNGDKYIYILNFDHNYLPHVAHKERYFGSEIIGFERVVRKTEQEFYFFDGSGYGSRLSYDAIKVHRDTQDFYIYMHNGRYGSFNLY